jgi:hypothetical protein
MRFTWSISATCHEHVIAFILTIFDEECQSWNTSLCSFIQSHCTYHPFSPNILLSTPFSNTMKNILPIMHKTKLYTCSHKNIGKIQAYFWIFYSLSLQIKSGKKNILGRVMADIQWLKFSNNIPIPLPPFPRHQKFTFLFEIKSSRSDFILKNKIIYRN